MNNSAQAPLFHEDIFEAMNTVIMALGGSKKVGGMLWPEKKPQLAGEYLKTCLNVTRQEKLGPEQVLFLMVEGQKVGCHAMADYIGQHAGYKFMPIDPEDEKAELQKQVVAASHGLSEMIKRLEKLAANG